MRKCPDCNSKNIRNFHVDDEMNELTESQISKLTTGEKEIAAQSECNECYYSDFTEHFPIIYDYE